MKIPWRRMLAARFWGRTFRQGGITTWMHEPLVRCYINQSVSGDPNVWPMEWLRQFLGVRSFDEGLSLGCGDGALERDIRRKDISRNVLGIDASSEALMIARAKAVHEKFTGIRYQRGDLNVLRLEPSSFDIAFFHQSLHHVENLESCVSQVHRSLREGGLLYLDEYVGPSRRQWRRSLIADAEAVFAGLPAAVKRRRRLALPVDRRGDPTEAIRSSEILDSVKGRFEVLEKRDYGGNLLAVIYPHLDLAAIGEEARNDLIGHLIECERKLLQAGAVSYSTVILARAL